MTPLLSSLTDHNFPLPFYSELKWQSGEECETSRVVREKPDPEKPTRFKPVLPTYKNPVKPT